MFYTDRIYTSINPSTGEVEWFFSTREGEQGPFQNVIAAREKLDAHIRLCVANESNGGRSNGKGLY